MGGRSTAVLHMIPQKGPVNSSAVEKSTIFHYDNKASAATRERKNRILGDRLTVGHCPLEAGIGVRIPVPQRSYDPRTGHTFLRHEVKRLCARRFGEESNNDSKKNMSEENSS